MLLKFSQREQKGGGGQLEMTVSSSSPCWRRLIVGTAVA